MRTLLIVDGDCEKRQTLGFALRCAGYFVREAASAAQALAFAEASQERLVVLLAQWMDPAESGRILSAAAHDPDGLGRHRYLLLATCPRRIEPALLDVMERLGVEVVRRPFDMEQLLASLQAAAGGIHGPAAPGGEWNERVPGLA